MGFSTLLSGVSRLFGKEEVGGSNPLGSSKSEWTLLHSDFLCRKISHMYGDRTIIKT